jgi:hypothetical protein
MKATLILIVAALVWTVGYLIACAVFPFSACRVCGGSGKRRSGNGKNFRRCRRCRGDGARVRVGRRLWTFWTKHRGDLE